MGLLIDTSILVDFERAEAELAEALSTLGDEPLFLSAVSASELLHGMHRANSEQLREKRRTFVEGVFSLLPILAFDLEAARVHARISADLRSRGATIGSHDLLIAATALCHGLTIVTANQREFRRVDGLEVRTG